MRSSSLVLLLLPLFLATLSLATAAGSAPRRALLDGGWAPIKNLGDPHVLDIANFAVSEINKEAKSTLVLNKVIEGETQIVAGVNYKLVIQAEDGDAIIKYEVIVWEKDWEHLRKLISFKAV